MLLTQDKQYISNNSLKESEVKLEYICLKNKSHGNHYHYPKGCTEKVTPFQNQQPDKIQSIFLMYVF